MRKTNILTIISLVIFLIAILLAVFNFSFAQESPAKSTKKPFGGRILTTTVCNTGFWITVGSPRAGSFMVMPTTLRYGAKIYRPGAWAMGIALSPLPEASTGNNPEAELAGGAGAKKGDIPCYVGVKKIGEGELVLIIGASK